MIRDYYAQVFDTFANEVVRVSHQFSPKAKKIVHSFEKEIAKEQDFVEYLSSNRSTFKKLSRKVTVKDLLDMSVEDLNNFDDVDIDNLELLEIIVGEIVRFLEIFFKLGLIKTVSEDKLLSSRWDDSLQQVAEEIIDRELLVMAIDYLKVMNEDASLRPATAKMKKAKLPSLKPYAIKAMFYGKKLGDCFAKLSI